MVDDVPRAQVWTATVDPAGRTFSLNASIVLPNGLLKSFNAPKSVGKDDATTLVTLAVCVGSVLAKAPGATSQQCVTALGLDVLIRAAISAFDTPPYRMSAAPARVTQGASVQVPIEVQFQPDFGGPVADFEIDGGTETYKAKGLKLEFDRYQLNASGRVNLKVTVDRSAKQERSIIRVLSYSYNSVQRVDIPITVVAGRGQLAVRGMIDGGEWSGSLAPSFLLVTINGLVRSITKLPTTLQEDAGKVGASFVALGGGPPGATLIRVDTSKSEIPVDGTGTITVEFASAKAFEAGKKRRCPARLRSLPSRLNPRLRHPKRRLPIKSHQPRPQ